MKEKTHRLFCALALCLLLSSNVFSNTDLAAGVIEKVRTAVSKLNRFSFELSNCERIEGEIKCGIQKVIVQQNPFKCHIIFVEPKTGDQLVFNEEWSDGDALYLPEDFPYIDMKLDPLGSQMRKDNHHTIFELGFSFFADLVGYYYRLKPESFKAVKLKNGSLRIISEFNDFKYNKERVVTTQTSRKFAQKRMICEHHIFERNKKRMLRKDQLIEVPNYYYSRMEIDVDQTTWLPLHIRVYDDKGLFENYGFSDLNTNPVFDDALFLPEKRL